MPTLLTADRHDARCRGDRRSPARPAVFGSSPKIARGLIPPHLMIAWGGGFAPAPGDRRSPLQVVSLAMDANEGFA